MKTVKSAQKPRTGSAKRTASRTDQKQMGDSMTSMKSTTNEIKAAAEAELAELSSQKSGSTRQKSNPRLLKPIAVAESLNSSNNSLM